MSRPWSDFITRYMTSITAACMLLAAPAAAVPPVGKLQAGCQRVDPAHTQIIFFPAAHGVHALFGHVFRHDFSGVSGTLQLDPAHPSAARLTVSVPIGSLQATRNRLTGELKDVRTGLTRTVPGCDLDRHIGRARWHGWRRYFGQSYTAWRDQPGGPAGPLCQHGRQPAEQRPIP